MKVESIKQKERYTQIKLKLHNKNDIDILLKLEVCANKQGYIKELIRNDIRAEISAYNNSNRTD